MTFVWQLLLGGSFCVKAAAAADTNSVQVSVALKPGQPFEIRPGRSAADVAATGSFDDNLLRDGWGILNIETNNAHSDSEQAFAAGVIEGFLTARHIFAAQYNLFPVVFGNTALQGYVGDYSTNETELDDIKEFMNRQEAWTRVMVSQQAGTDPFWAHVGYLMAQFDGLVEGYGEATRRNITPALDRFAFQMLNGVGDLFDIIPAVKRHRRIDWLSLSLETAELLHARKGHCSALIKPTADFSDLFMAHSSWFTYSNTDRIFKHYFLNFNDPSTAARRISFSSYPGFLESLDDFYLLDSGLRWVQTTNTVVDHGVYDEVKPESLLAWQRVRVASAMSSSGREWYKHMSRHFSGTYANQYMIVDFKLFEPKRMLKPNLLWIVEEMPGLILGRDCTETLSRGYWPSYNVPYFPEIWSKSGYPAMAAKHHHDTQGHHEGGNFWTYELCPRAKIFRRDQGTVVNMSSLKSLMRYNNYLEDPLSLDEAGRPNPTFAICARSDLHATNASTNGCYDTKVTSYQFGAMRQRAQALNSMSHYNLPPFSWADGKFPKQRHFGLPDTYPFDFIDIEPKALSGFSAAGQNANHGYLI